MMKINWKKLLEYIDEKIKEIIDSFKDKEPLLVDPIPDEPAEPIATIPNEPIIVPPTFSTEQKFIYWSECQTISAEVVAGLGIHPSNIIITDSKLIKARVEAVQRTGALVYMAVHPRAGRFNEKTNGEALETVKNNYKMYDGVVIDFEINFQSIDFLRAVRLLIGKTPLSIAPISRIDFMTKFYPQLADMLDLGIMWWNYSYDYASMLEHLHKYQFHKSVKQNFLLALGNKYNDILTDKRNEEIVRNLPIRCGAFNPKRSNRGWSEIKRMKDLLQVNK